MRRAPLLALCFLALSGCYQPARLRYNNLATPATSPTPTAVSSPPATAVEAAPPVTAYVVRSDARLRDGPGASGEVLRHMSVGETMAVLHPERGGPWYEVSANLTGQRGWVHESVIRFKPGAVDPPPTATPTPKPTPSPTPKPAPTPESEEEEEDERTGGMYDVKVWVNTNSGVYHCPGTRWYGNTKEGEYMTQKQAIDSGNRPAYGKFCN